MRRAITEAKVKTRTEDRATERTKVDNTILAGIMGLGGATSFLIGLWAAACVVSGLITAGGPIQFVKSWFSAVTGG